VVEGRRRVSRTAATISDTVTGEILASAEGTYVAAPDDRREELKARYRFRLVPETRRASAGIGAGPGAEPTDRGAGR
jgi:hypothetical protein